MRYETGRFGHSQKQDYVFVLSKEVQPNESYTWAIEMRAPQNLGSYKADFAFYSKQGAVCQRDLSGGSLEVKIKVVNQIT